MSEAAPLCLVVDREHAETRALVAFLRSEGFEVAWTHDDEGAANVLDRRRVDCLVSEARAPRIDGLALLERARARNADVCAVMMTEGADVAVAVEAMRRGAYDFQPKPVRVDKLLATLRLGLAHQRVAARMAEIEDELDRRYGARAIAGRSRAAARVRDQVRPMAALRAPVLIVGEPGTGKSVVAHALHQNGPRRDRRFVRVAVSAVPPAVLETELFGAEPAGSPPRPGHVEMADGGTLFLDGVEWLSPQAQVRLLRLIQERTFERVGGRTTQRADVRVIAATEADLAGEVREGRFRDDLHAALTLLTLRVPPLRERLEDLPELVAELVREANRSHGRRVGGVSAGVLDRLAGHDWPGNVSELKRVIDTMVAAASGRRPLDVSALPDGLRGPAGRAGPLAISVGMTVAEAERALVAATLRHTGGDRRRAAQLLGIGLRTLYRKLAADPAAGSGSAPRRTRRRPRTH